jgi:hypothetical protein
MDNNCFIECMPVSMIFFVRVLIVGFCVKTISALQ